MYSSYFIFSVFNLDFMHWKDIVFYMWLSLKPRIKPKFYNSKVCLNWYVLEQNIFVAMCTKLSEYISLCLCTYKHKTTHTCINCFSKYRSLFLSFTAGYVLIYKSDTCHITCEYRWKRILNQKQTHWYPITMTNWVYSPFWKHSRTFIPRSSRSFKTLRKGYFKNYFWSLNFQMNWGFPLWVLHIYRYICT